MIMLINSYSKIDKFHSLSVRPQNATHVAIRKCQRSLLK